MWLQNNPRIDMPKVKQTLDEMNWSGWLVIERSRDARDSRNVRRNFGANVDVLEVSFSNQAECASLVLGHAVVEIAKWFDVRRACSCRKPW